MTMAITLKVVQHPITSATLLHPLATKAPLQGGQSLLLVSRGHPLSSLHVVLWGAGVEWSGEM